MEMETSWKDIKIHITIHNESVLFKTKDQSEVFDLSPWIPPSIMQYVLTRELSSLQSVLQMRGYVLEFDGKHVNVFHVSGKTPKILQNVGNDLCNVLSAFLTRFETRPILPKLNGDQTDLNEMNLQNVLVTWDPSSCCYWLSGEEKEVEEAYNAIKQEYPFLWTINGEVTFKVEDTIFTYSRII